MEAPEQTREAVTDAPEQAPVTMAHVEVDEAEAMRAKVNASFAEHLRKQGKVPTPRLIRALWRKAARKAEKVKRREAFRRKNG